MGWLVLGRTIVGLGDIPGGGRAREPCVRLQGSRASEPGRLGWRNIKLGIKPVKLRRQEIKVLNPSSGVSGTLEL